MQTLSTNLMLERTIGTDVRLCGIDINTRISRKKSSERKGIDTLQRNGISCPSLGATYSQERFPFSLKHII